MSTNPSLESAFRIFDDDSTDEEQIDLPIPEPATESVSHNAKPLDVQTGKVSLWHDFPPKYMGPMEYIANAVEVGGGRGYIAAQDIPAGTLLLVEELFFPWADSHQDVLEEQQQQNNSALFIHTLEDILNHPEWQLIVQQFQLLFPVRLDELPKKILENGKKMYSKPLSEILEKRNNLELTLDMLLQIVFAMQCNAFGSGVFLHTAIFNHACIPNCVKFTPESSQVVGNGESCKKLSEVRAAQSIKKGEPLTISYLHPKEQSQESRRKQLLAQFGFLCRCTFCESNVSTTSSDKSTSADFEEIENNIPVAEDMCRSGNPVEALRYVLDLLSDALEKVSYDHYIFIRIHSLITDCSERLLSSLHDIVDDEASIDDKFKEYAVLFLRSSYELLELQMKYLNKDHIDFARTYNDISQGIEILLSECPEVLLTEFPEWKSFREASLSESKYRKEYQRIKTMYD